MDLLENKKCKPCTGNTEILTFDKKNQLISDLNDWTLNDNKDMIFKKFIFNNFKNTLHFVNLIGNLAEEEGHHPDISLGWGYCLIMIHTHAIKNLSINDFILASKIDKIEKKI